MRVAGLVQGLFAFASASLAAWSFAYGDFAWGAQSSLASIPWRETWIYASAVILLAASAGLCFPRTALPGVLTIGAYQTVGAAIAVPQILSEPLSIGAWYPFCEALTALAGAWVLYAMLRWSSRGPGTMNPGVETGIHRSRLARRCAALGRDDSLSFGRGFFLHSSATPLPRCRGAPPCPFLLLSIGERERSAEWRTFNMLTVRR